MAFLAQPHRSLRALGENVLVSDGDSCVSFLTSCGAELIEGERLTLRKRNRRQFGGVGEEKGLVIDDIEIEGRVGASTETNFH